MTDQQYRRAKQIENKQATVQSNISRLEKIYDVEKWDLNKTVNVKIIPHGEYDAEEITLTRDDIWAMRNYFLDVDKALAKEFEEL